MPRPSTPSLPLALVLVVATMTSTGCGDEPWESGSKLTADVYDQDGIHTLIDFVDEATKQHCVGDACGAFVGLETSFRTSEIAGLEMEGLEGDDGSWQYVRLHDYGHDAPCSMQPFDGEVRCVAGRIFATATKSCAEETISCSADDAACTDGVLAVVDVAGEAVIYELGSETDPPTDAGCAVESCEVGCIYRALDKVDPTTLPRVYEKNLGSGKWVLPSYTSQDGSWSVPVQTNTLLDTTTNTTCRLVRASDGSVTCEPIAM